MRRVAERTRSPSHVAIKRQRRKADYLDVKLSLTSLFARLLAGVVSALLLALIFVSAAFAEPANKPCEPWPECKCKPAPECYISESPRSGLLYLAGGLVIIGLFMAFALLRRRRTATAQAPGNR